MYSFKTINQKVEKALFWREVAYGKNISVFKKISIDIDLCTSWVIIGSHIDEFFKYRLHEKRIKERKQFILDRQRRLFRKRINNEIDAVIFDNKKLFNSTFSDFLKRDWIDCTSCSYDDYVSFASKYPDGFFKPIEGSFGDGIGILNNNEDYLMPSFFEKLKQSHAIVEETIKQIPEMAELNPSSINTIRVVTLIDNKGNTHIMAAVLRAGRKGKLADNFHHQGIAAKIDINTGKVVSNAVDSNLKIYEKHPDSNCNIVGFAVPMWDSVKELCLDAAGVIPTVRYVGWDVALSLKGPCIIEGNCGADPDITQMPTDKGVWEEFKILL